jgi:hypothetical protein
LAWTCCYPCLRRAVRVPAPCPALTVRELEHSYSQVLCRAPSRLAPPAVATSWRDLLLDISHSFQPPNANLTGRTSVSGPTQRRRANGRRADHFLPAATASYHYFFFSIHLRLPRSDHRPPALVLSRLVSCLPRHARSVSARPRDKPHPAALSCPLPRCPTSRQLRASSSHAIALHTSNNVPTPANLLWGS